MGTIEICQHSVVTLIFLNKVDKVSLDVDCHEISTVSNLHECRSDPGS
jgi:translation elongation factor EF-G